MKRTILAFLLISVAHWRTAVSQEVALSDNWHCGHNTAPRPFAQAVVAAQFCKHGALTNKVTLGAVIEVLRQEQWFHGPEEEWGCTSSVALLAIKEVERWASDQAGYCRTVNQLARNLPFYAALRKRRLAR
jgi:hypothetical protein